MIINEDRVEIHGPFLMQKIRKEGIPVAGRKPKPTALKKLEGNPGKRKLNTKEPIPAKGMREDLKAVERLRKTAEQLSRQELDKPHDREPER